jgi:arginase family enzyme
MRTLHVLGVPLRTGSLYPGTENDAQAYRDVDLVGRLRAVGCDVVDDGDVVIPSFLPHHSIPPVRSWPGPRIAWDCVAERVGPLLAQPGHVPLLIGCDCSVVVGTTQAVARASADEVHVLYVDGDFDDAAPDPTRCQSAAALAAWLLTHASPFWTGPPLRPSQVTVLGASGASLSGLNGISLAEMRRAGAREAARQALAAIPESARVVLHLDIDVFAHADLPAAYFPHQEGLTRSEGAALLGPLLSDPRLALVEIAEYASLRDADRRAAAQLSDLLAAGLVSDR